MVKFGILYCAYGDISNARKSISHIVNFRKNNKNVFVGCVSVPFKNYNFIRKQDNTPSMLMELEHSGKIDKVFTEPKFIEEKDARTLPLRFLVEMGCDWIFIVDGDEMYTENQLRRILEFCETAKDTFYSAHFRTFIFRMDTFREDCTHRLFSVHQHGGIDRFIDDNDVSYKDGWSTRGKNCNPIPKIISFPAHVSWVQPERIIEKSRYQVSRWNYCSVREIDGKIVYVDRYNIQDFRRVPQISIVIPSLRNKKYLDTLVTSLTEDSSVEHEILVLATSEIEPNKFGNGVKFIQIEKDIGISRAIDVGIQNSSKDHVMFIGDNYVAPPFWDIGLGEELKENQLIVFDSFGPGETRGKNFGSSPDDFRYEEFRLSKEIHENSQKGQPGVHMPFIISKRKYLTTVFNRNDTIPEIQIDYNDLIGFVTGNFEIKCFSGHRFYHFDK